MSMFFCPLRSGSSGNALLAQAGAVRVLIDAGLSGREIERSLAVRDVKPESLAGILISHEHSDHIKGVGILSRRFDLPVYATEGTWGAMDGKPGIDGIALKNRRAIYAGEDFYIGDLAVSPFRIPHDAADPIGFSLMYGARKLSVATDLGHIAKEWLKAVSGSDLMLLESNHDPDLLNGHPRYPTYLKRRILGRKGHLSNCDCGKALLQLIGAGLRHVILGHLSAETNTPALAYETVCRSLLDAGVRPGEDVQLDIAYRDQIGDVFAIQ